MNHQASRVTLGSQMLCLGGFVTCHSADVATTTAIVDETFPNFMVALQAVPFNWIEYAHRALHWQVKDGGENFCSETWANKCSDEHGEEGFPLHPGNGLPVDGAEGKCCWCTAVWHLWLGNSNPGREPKLKCNFWGGNCIIK